MKTRTLFTVTYGCDPQNVGKARQLIIRDLMAMQKENVTPAELQQAKALLLRQIPLAESSEDGVAGGMLARAVIGLPLDEAGARREGIFFHDGRPGTIGFREMDTRRWLRASGSRAGRAVGL